MATPGHILSNHKQFELKIGLFCELAILLALIAQIGSHVRKSVAISKWWGKGALRIARKPPEPFTIVILKF